VLEYTARAVKLYAFDVDGERLDQLPLAARRALDHAGWKLSLSGWNSLPLSRRRRLTALGSVSPVDVAEVTQIVQGATPPAILSDVHGDPPRAQPPAVVVQAFAEQGRISQAVWSSLADVDRYSLEKVASRGNPERLAGAFAEIVGHTQVSTHVRPSGGVQMVNVGDKAVTRRRAEAESRVSMNREAFALLQNHAVPKGDVLATARIAAIMAAKRTSELIPLCHAIALTHVGVELRLDTQARSVEVRTSVETIGKTGVEMEALVAASHAALTVYDMLKAIDRGMQIGPTRLLEKSGGASGDFVASVESERELASDSEATLAERALARRGGVAGSEH